MIRYYIIFQGQVQGVGFRSYCIMLANEYRLTGTVRNMENGMVEMQVQGNQSNIDKVLSIITQGNMFIKITDFSKKQLKLVNGERDFRTIY